MLIHQPSPTTEPRKRIPRSAETTAKKPPASSAGQGVGRCCPWCGNPLPAAPKRRGGQRRRWCSGSCRTLAHRCKSRLIPGAAAAVFECPLDESERMLDQAGISRVTALLKAAGVEFQPHRRAFVDRAGRIYA
jgi:hypothetical protein